MGNKKVGMLSFLIFTNYYCVNCMLDYSFKQGTKAPMLTLHKALARELLHNPYLPNKPKNVRKQDLSKNLEHVLLNNQTHKKFRGSS